MYIYSTTTSDANKGCYEYLCPLIVYDRSLLPVSLRSQLYFAPLFKASLGSYVFPAAFSTSSSSCDASTLCAPLFHKRYNRNTSILERNLSTCKHKNASPRPAACGIPKHRILPPTIKVIHRTMFQGFLDLRTQIYPSGVGSERRGGVEKNATCGCCSMTLTNGRSRRGCNLVVIRMGTGMSSSLISSKVHGTSIRRQNHQ